MYRERADQLGGSGSWGTAGINGAASTIDGQPSGLRRTCAAETKLPRRDPPPVHELVEPTARGSSLAVLETTSEAHHLHGRCEGGAYACLAGEPGDPHEGRSRAAS
jgi:hypothetical protein